MQMVESETRVPYMTASEPAQYAVFGQPVAHSLSPRIHNAFARQLGIALEYRPIETSANVTLPLKQVAAKACASLSDRARRADSVNTLSRSGDGWHGDSTDGVGLIRDITSRHRLFVRGRRTLLLGAGGAARAVAFALLDAGVPELTIANRTPERALDADDVHDALAARGWLESTLRIQSADYLLERLRCR